MAQLTDLLTVQTGAEVTRGTAVAPTAKLTGVGEGFRITPVRRSLRHQEMRGSLAPAYNATLTFAEATASMPVIWTYEDAPLILNSAFSEAVPTGDGPYTYTYAAPLTAPATPRPRTIVLGDTTYAYNITGALVSSFSISGSAESEITGTVEWIGVDSEVDTLAVLPDRDVSAIMGQHAALYIDAHDGTMGSTAINATAWEFELNVNCNRANTVHLGSTTPDGWFDRKWEGTLRLLLELNATTDGYVADILTSSPLEKQISIVFTSGTKSFTIEFAGIVEEAPALYNDQDGIVGIDLTFSGMYNDAYGNWLGIEVVNGVDTLP